MASGDRAPQSPAWVVDRPLTVLDPRGRVALPGVPGELCLNEVRTGLRAWSLPDGRTGVLGPDVVVRGRVLWLDPLASVLAAEPGVAGVALVPHEERLIAALVPESGVDGDELVRRCRAAITSRLPEGYLPHVLAVVPHLPRTWTGELDTGLLTVAELAGRQQEADDPVVARIARLLADVLELDHVNPGDDLFDLGGTSLSAARLIAGVEKEFGARLSLRDAFAHPTVAGLAALVRAADPAKEVEELRRLPREGAAFELSHAQRRLWYVEQLGGGVSYVVFLAVRLHGLLDTGALGGALADIVERHEPLRTRFAEVDGVPVQFVATDVLIGMPVTPLTGLSAEDQEREVRRIAEREQAGAFDLTSGEPLLRTRLLVLAADHHVLLISAHHIICDGWSFDVLLRDLSARYTHHTAGVKQPLPELPVQYVDYADWQRRWLAGSGYTGQVAHWREELGTPPVEFELETDRPRPAVQTFSGAVHRFDLPPGVVGSLRALGRAEGTSLFVVLLAGFQALLAGVSGQRDVVVATPSANRRRWETEHLVGFFVNMLLVRARLGERPSFRELVAQVRGTVLAADANGDVPFELLVDELMDGRDPSRQPLATVMFLMDTVSERLRAGDLELERLRVDWTTAKYDLSLLVDNVADDCHCVLEYNSDLFEPETVELLARRLVAFLGRVAADPEVRL